MFLELNEKEFKRALHGMLPLVDGPPANYLLDLLKPHPEPVCIQNMIYRSLKRKMKINNDNFISIQLGHSR